MKTRLVVACVFAPAWLLSLLDGATAKAQSPDKDAAALYSSSEAVREGAANRLIQAGPKTIHLLVPILCDRNKPNFNSAWRSAAKVLGRLKAEEAAPCLVQLLGSGDVTLSPFMSRDLIEQREPAFSALVEIGEAAVPSISRALPSLHPDSAYLGLRVLSSINIPSARTAVENYINFLEKQTQLAKEILQGFSSRPAD